MKTIHKYEIQLGEYTTLVLPYLAQVLDFQVQDNRFYIWCLVEPEEVLGKRYFKIFGTGHPIPGFIAYLGTIQHDGYVWHLFEI